MLYQLSYTHHVRRLQPAEPRQSTVPAASPSTAFAAACASSLLGPGSGTNSVWR